MTSEKGAGRTVGVLLLLHLAAGLIAPFILLHPLVSPRGFLASAATIPNQRYHEGGMAALATRSGWRAGRRRVPSKRLRLIQSQSAGPE